MGTESRTRSIVGLGVIVMLAACSGAVPPVSNPPQAAPSGARVEAEPRPIAARDPAPIASGHGGGDLDGDGIPDELDECPGIAEAFNGFEDEDGCPEIGCRLPVDSSPSINVMFDEGEIVPTRARAGLEDLARSFVQSGATDIEVAGHADSRGKIEGNDRLARRRAVAVRTMLIEGGVSPEVLRVVVHGEEQPIASNDTDAGRRRNRRVEIICIEGC